MIISRPIEQIAKYVIVLACVACLPACRQLQNSGVPVVAETSGFARGVLETPEKGVRRDKAIADAAEAIKDKVSQIDIEAANETVNQIKQLIEDMNFRLASLQEQVSGAIKQAQLSELTYRLQQASAEATSKLGKLNTEIINEAVDDVQRLAEQLSEKLEQVDIKSANRLLTESAALRPQAEETLQELTALTKELREAVRSLPLAELSTTAKTTSHAVTTIEQTFTLLRFLLFILVIVVVVAVPWRIIRRARGADS